MKEINVNEGRKKVHTGRTKDITAPFTHIYFNILSR